MMRRSVPPPLAWLVLTLTISGCGAPPLIQVETVIHPDGSCDRAIWQPKDRLLPDGALQPAWNARWTSVADVAVLPAFQGEAPASTESPYFHARGGFATPADIPSHFRKSFEGRPELGASEIEPSYRRVDYGLFVEHRWSERVTNNVTREDFEKARDAFLALAAPWLVDGVRAVYGEDFDVSAAVQELERRGPPLFRDLIDGWYDALAAGDAESSSKVLIDRFVRAVERAGVDLHDATGTVVASEEGTRRIRKHLAERIAATFRRRDGSPPTAEQVETVLASGSGGPPYSSAWSSYFAGRKDEFEERIVPLLVRITGCYGYPPILQAPGPRFVFSARLPGEIIGIGSETNGEVVDGRISWRFDSNRLFPGGFTMTARSIEVDADAQRRLFGRVAFPKAESAQVVRDLLADDPGAIERLRRAVEESDPDLLRPTPEMDEDRKMRLARFKELVDKNP